MPKLFGSTDLGIECTLPPYYDKSDESYKSQNSKESSDSASSPVPNSPDRDGCDELDKSLLDMEEATDVAIEWFTTFGRWWCTYKIFLYIISLVYITITFTTRDGFMRR